MEIYQVFFSHIQQQTSPRPSPKGKGAIPPGELTGFVVMRVFRDLRVDKDASQTRYPGNSSMNTVQRLAGLFTHPNQTLRVSL